MIFLGCGHCPCRDSLKSNHSGTMKIVYYSILLTLSVFCAACRPKELDIGYGYTMIDLKREGGVVVRKSNQIVLGPRVQGVMDNGRYFYGWIAKQHKEGGIAYFLLDKESGQVSHYETLRRLDDHLYSLGIEPLDMANEMTYYDYVSKGWHSTSGK